jgi:phage terminase Nu1 subunit (DNA packaging protein)
MTAGGERGSLGPDRVALLEPYIDARQLAAVLGVSTTTIKRMVARGMPSETWGRRTRRFRASECIDWARAQATVLEDNPPDSVSDERRPATTRRYP